MYMMTGSWSALNWKDKKKNTIQPSGEEIDVYRESESEKSQITKLLFSVVLFSFYSATFFMYIAVIASLFFSLFFNFFYVCLKLIYCGMYINMQYVFNMSFTSSPSSRPLSLHLFWPQRHMYAISAFYQLKIKWQSCLKFSLFFLITVIFLLKKIMIQLFSSE